MKYWCKNLSLTVLFLLLLFGYSSNRMQLMEARELLAEVLSASQLSRVLEDSNQLRRSEKITNEIEGKIINYAAERNIRHTSLGFSVHSTLTTGSYMMELNEENHNVLRSYLENVEKGPGLIQRVENSLYMQWIKFHQ